MCIFLVGYYSRRIADLVVPSFKDRELMKREAIEDLSNVPTFTIYGCCIIVALTL